MAGQAATLGSMHVCPMVTGYVPHVGGPVIGPGVSTVLIGGKPAAVMGDMVTCIGPPDTIVQGESTVLIGGKPAATVGCMTAHGGTITSGEPTVLIGTGGSGATAVMAVNKIPFPNISFVSKVKASFVGKAKELKNAMENQEQLKKEAEEKKGEQKVIKVEWLSEDIVVKDSQMVKNIKVKAYTINADDGVTVNFSVTRFYKEHVEDEEELVEDVIKLSGTVQEGEAIAEFEIEDYEKEDN